MPRLLLDEPLHLRSLPLGEGGSLDHGIGDEEIVGHGISAEELAFLGDGAMEDDET